MTEAEWERGVNRVQMLDYLGDRLSVRKYQLLAVAYCHRQWDLFPPIPHRQAIKAAEQIADGGDIEGFRQVIAAARQAMTSRNTTKDMEHSSLAFAAYHATASELSPRDSLLAVAGALSSVMSDRLHIYRREFDPEPDPEEYQQISLLHDIAGNPFRPVSVNPEWLTSTVVAIARQIYMKKGFTAMPILADALLDAGCEDPEVIDHCRSGGPHVRGCWVVDMVLGKS